MYLYDTVYDKPSFSNYFIKECVVSRHLLFTKF